MEKDERDKRIAELEAENSRMALIIDDVSKPNRTDVPSSDSGAASLIAERDMRIRRDHLEGLEKRAEKAEAERHKLQLYFSAMYAEACPNWAMDGNPRSMIDNVKRYRENAEAECSKWEIRAETAIASKNSDLTDSPEVQAQAKKL